MKGVRKTNWIKRIGVMGLMFALLFGTLGSFPSEVKAVELQTTAVLTKELTIPENIAAPAGTFSFDVTKKGVGNDTNGACDTSRSGECPQITLPQISFSGADKGSASNNIVKSQDIMAAIKAVTYPHAGIYYYDIKESGDIAGITNSQAEYTLQVHVINSGSDLVVKGITVNQNKTDDGGAADTKVDPTPNPTHGAFRFVNKYEEMTKVKIEKTVSGEYADKTKGFEFDISVTLPATSAATEVHYEDAEGNTQTLTITGRQGTISPTLTHGQDITFTDLPVGSTYTVTERGTSTTNYTPTAVVTGHGTAGTAAPGTAGTNYAVTVDGKTNLLVAREDANTSNVTSVLNSYYTPTITGFLIDNLPFILLIGAAGGGIVFLLLKRRRRMVRS